PILYKQRALTIHRDQHFFTRNTLLSCTDAPIYDHEGNLAAALDVSSCRADLTEGFINLIWVPVTDAARRIESENFRMAFRNARVLLAPSTDKGAGGLVAVDSDDLLIGATRSARLALGITEECLKKPAPVGDVFGESKKESENLGEAERGVLQRALARADGNVSAAAK